ncbi:MAG: LCP family protein [Erysipelotrichia bacterium]|nr:LCP family protein [Erysipelotrichia bacterium]
MKNVQKKNKKKRKIRKISLYTYLIYAIATMILFFVIKATGIFPNKYLFVVFFLFLIGIIVFGISAFIPQIKSKIKIAQSLICIVLSFLTIVSCVLLPHYSGKIARAFTRIPAEGTMNINVYVLQSSAYDNIGDLQGKNVGLQKKVDLDYQNYAIKVINKELNGQNIDVVQYEDIYELTDKLYNGEVQAILLNEDYAKILAENPNYKDFDTKTKVLYVCPQKIYLTSATNAVNAITSQPFLIAVSGNDEWDYSSIKANGHSRTDVNMLVAVNPVSKQILVLTIPRDSYVYLEGKGYDKLTHASLYGMNVWTQALKNIFNLDEINYYFRVNFQSVVSIVDAMGGIDVDNPYRFESDYCLYWDDNQNKVVQYNAVYDEGMIHLNGSQSLGYVRERYSLPDGDIGRNKHQAIFLKACINKLCSVQTITNISKLLDSLEGTFITDLDYNKEIIPLAQMQLNDMANWDIKTYSLNGYGDEKICYSLDDELYSVEMLNDDSIAVAKEYIRQVLIGESWNN